MSDPLDRLKQALADRYTIERELGRGGMAVVYLARDLKHERLVALKVLRPELAATVGAERFLREIRIAAQLNHPHILMLIDSGEVNDSLYYVMPYVEGESLRDKLARERELPIADAVRILRNVVDALAMAHSHGVIHRDIKPDNVMLSGRHALVADFGVAKALSQASGAQDVTTAGVALGTPAYMSPEQAVADEKVDHRSDIYAVGALAYELLTGRPPFLGTTAQMVLSAHVTDTPEPVSKYRDTVPPPLEHVVLRCLEKKPADRWQSAEELLSQLEALATPSGGMTPTMTRPVATVTRLTKKQIGWVGIAALIVVTVLGSWWLLNSLGSGTGRIESIAILPFENFAGDASQQHIVDGIHDAVIGEFFRIESIRPIGRTSVMRYRDTELTLSEIARELGVDAVMEGSVFSRGDSLRLQLNLVQTSPDEFPLWSKTYEANVGRALNVSGQVVRDVAATIEMIVAPEVDAQLDSDREVPAAAMDAFWQGEAHFRQRFIEQQLRSAVEMYDSATTLDPEFSLAHAKLSMSHFYLWWWWYDHSNQRLTMARDAAERALSLNAELPEAHLALAAEMIWSHRGDRDSAMQHVRIAQQLQPNNSIVMEARGDLLRPLGRWQESLEQYRRAAVLDPGNANAVFQAALTQLCRREYADAERLIRRAITLDPNSHNYPFMQADIYARLDGNGGRALPLLQGLLEQFGLFGGGFLYARNLYTLLAAIDTTDVIRRTVLRLAPSDTPAPLQAPADVYLLKADLHRLAGNTLLARVFCDSARVIDEALAPRLEEQGDVSVYAASVHARLGLAYAGLGDSVAAIREGEAAVRLLPLSADKFFGVHSLTALTRIYVMVGRHEAAIDGLEQLLSIPSWENRELARMHPWYAALRGNPRFEALVGRN